MKPPSLQFIEGLISRVLFWGALVSITVATTGLVSYIFHNGLGSDLQNQLRHQGGNQHLAFLSISQIGETIRTGANPLDITDLGLILLLMVPILSLMLLIPAFLKERDYRYSIISTVILFILLFGLMFGGA